MLHSICTCLESYYRVRRSWIICVTWIPLLLSFSDHTPADEFPKKEKKEPHHSVCQAWFTYCRCMCLVYKLAIGMNSVSGGGVTEGLNRYTITKPAHTTATLPIPFSELSSDVLWACRRWSSMYSISPPRLMKTRGRVLIDILPTQRED